MKKNIFLTLSLTAILFFTGCYTQLLTVNNTGTIPAPPTVQNIDTLEQNRVDTVVIRDNERETCYWTRDFFGDPVLKCYRTTYSSDWYNYNYSPWWYSRYDGYYDYDRCPRGYYYDRYSGYCRYYNDYRDCYNCYTGSSGSSSGSSATPPSSSKIIRSHRSRDYGIPKSASTSSATPSGYTAKKAAAAAPSETVNTTNIPSIGSTESNKRYPSAGRSRSYGVPKKTKVIKNSKVSSWKKSNNNEPTKKDVSIKDESSKDSQNAPEKKKKVNKSKKRGKSRGW